MKRVHRRDLLKSIAASASCLVLNPRRLVAGDPPASGSRPNLLVIQTDEHSFRTLGCYRATLAPEQAFMWGRETAVETPHIDALATEGALCTRFYATTPLCSPSRGSLLSGCYPMATGVLNNNNPLRDDVITFAELLRREGYATGYLGKWHLDGKGKPQWAPTRRFGFDDNRYMFNRGHWKQLTESGGLPAVKTMKAGEPSYDVAGADAESFTTDWLTDRTIAYIRRHADHPFCCMLSIPDPHDPDTVRAPYDKRFADMQFEAPRTAGKSNEGVPSWAQSKGASNKTQGLYQGMVKCIDDNIGRILAELRTQGLLDNTLVVFTADHGDMRGEHGRQDKEVPLEASARIPFLLRYPKRVRPGTRIDAALSCIDFLPTILGLMGVPTAGREAGHDASALFTGGQGATWKDLAIIRDANHKGWVAAIDRRYKLVVSSSDPPWLLDRDSDPDELRNHIEVPAAGAACATLARGLLDYHAKHQDPNLAAPGVLEQLRRLAG